MVDFDISLIFYHSKVTAMFFQPLFYLPPGAPKCPIQVSMKVREIDRLQTNFNHSGGKLVHFPSCLTRIFVPVIDTLYSDYARIYPGIDAVPCNEAEKITSVSTTRSPTQKSHPRPELGYQNPQLEKTTDFGTCSYAARRGKP